MSTDPNTTRLTERHLWEHTQMMEKKASEPSSLPWAEKAVRREQANAYFNRLHPTLVSGQTNRADELDDLNVGIPDSIPTQASNSVAPCAEPALGLVMFAPEKGACLDPPFERFLTPDASSDPTYFAKPALERLGISYGGLEGVAARKQLADARAEDVRKRSKKNKASSSL